MADLFLWFVTMFGGVFGGLIGFVFIGASGALMALPFILLTKRPRAQARNRREILSDRYS